MTVRELLVQLDEQGHVTADRGGPCSLKAPSRPVDWRCQDAKCLQVAASLTPRYSSCVVPQETREVPVCRTFKLSDGLEPSTPPYHGGSGRQTRKRAISQDIFFPGNRVNSATGPAPRDVARVVSDVSVLCPAAVDRLDNRRSRFDRLDMKVAAIRVIGCWPRRPFCFRGDLGAVRSLPSSGAKPMVLSPIGSPSLRRLAAPSRGQDFGR
jgi:hypothetical protein